MMETNWHYEHRKLHVVIKIHTFMCIAARSVLDGAQTRALCTPDHVILTSRDETNVSSSRVSVSTPHNQYCSYSLLTTRRDQVIIT